MAEELVPNNPGGGDYEKERPPPPPHQKKQKIGEDSRGSFFGASKTQSEEGDDDIEQVNAFAVAMVLSKEDTALDEAASWLNRFYPGGRCDDADDKWFKYLRLIVDSEGFDMDMDELPVADLRKLPLLPVPNPNGCQRLVGCAEVAINQINQKKDTNYEFVKISTANVKLWCHGTNRYITFEAVHQNHDPSTCLTTFQALVWTGPEAFSPYVKFVRPKVVEN